MMRLQSCLFAIPLVAACASDAPVPTPPDCAIVANVVETLRWKRVDAYVGDLERALDLRDAALCEELGQLECASTYRIPLGGSDPFGAAIFEAPKAPMNTTPLVVERVALAGCSNRAAADAAGTPSVFTHVDLGASSVSASDTGVTAQVDDLYRRLLSRNPTDAERNIVTSLADGNNGRDFAVLACFTIATSTEALFF